MEYVCLSFLVRTSSNKLFVLALGGHGHVAFFVLDVMHVGWLYDFVVCVLYCIVVCGAKPCCRHFK